MTTIEKVRERVEIKSLTGLRGFVALYIFLFHMARWPYLRPGFVANLIDQGPIGMTIFFVLSGFVLAYQYAGKQTSYPQYARNRFARIYPIYLLCALLSVSTLWQLSAQKVSTLVAANLFLIQAWFPPFFSQWNDGLSWSLSVEAFCYVLLPFLITVLIGRSRRTLLLVAFFAYCAGMFPGAVYHAWDHSDWVSYYAMPIFRLPQFVLGVCACLLLRLEFAPRVKSWLWSLAALAAVLYIGFFGPRYQGYITLDWLVVPAVILTIYYLASETSVVSRLLSLRPVIWFGHVSYCFYSFQVLVVGALLLHYRGIVRWFPFLANNVVLLAVSFVGLTVVSGLGYHWIEEPLRKRIRTMHA